MSKQELIKQLYFNHNYKQVDIAEELNVSTKYVSKVLLKDERYKEEKERRKNIANLQHRQKAKEYMRKKRKSQNIDLQYEYLKHQQNQDAFELSGGKGRINNTAFKKWNSSAYNYNPKTKSYYLDKSLTAGFDVPKIIRW